VRSTIRGRRAFTLIELLAVIAIISLLVSLLLPAVQMAREAARGTQCKNNLKQIGLAMQNYLDTMQVFPPGYIAGKDTIADTTPGWGWAVMILPFMESSTVTGRLNCQMPIEDPSSKTGVAQLVPGFLCPSDLVPNGTFAIASDPAGTMPIVDTTPCSYVGCVGNDGCEVDDNATPWNGILYRNSRTSVEDIVDGTSSTFLVGERAWALVNGTWVGTPNNAVIQGGKQNKMAPVTATAAVAILAHAHWINNKYDSDGGLDDFSSMHPGGAHFLFADGSVHFLKEVTTPGGWDDTYQAMATRNGHEAVTF
jgi:prepilin-type N-terminal cleavage/methylation domain-containing protein/prepilin-type processing-associated H-X9-DG protein